MKMKLFKKLSLLLVVAIMACFICIPTFADSTQVSVYLDDVNLGTYTTTQLANNFTNYVKTYSSHNCKTNGYVYYDVNGPLLADVLGDAGVDVNDIATIEFVETSPYYTSGALDMNTVLSGKYFSDPNQTGVAVAPVLGLAYANRGVTPLTSTNCIRNFHGQQAATDNTMEKWTKSIDRINLVSK